MSGKKIPVQLATPNDLKESDRLKVAASINPLVADAFALYVKTKAFHWHLSGPHFRDYHLLFDEQADQIFATIDPLAERVRKLGGTTICSVGHIARLQTLTDDNEADLNATEMLHHLLHDNQKMAASMRGAHLVCNDAKDVATESLLEIYIDETERRIWFLFETLQRS